MTGFLSSISRVFDNIDHVLLLKAVRKHVTCNWALLYIERWLTAPMEQEGVRMERMRGTPQGGVRAPFSLIYSFTTRLTCG